MIIQQALILFKFISTLISISITIIYPISSSSNSSSRRSIMFMQDLLALTYFLQYPITIMQCYLARKHQVVEKHTLQLNTLIIPVNTNNRSNSNNSRWECLFSTLMEFIKILLPRVKSWTILSLAFLPLKIIQLRKNLSIQEQNLIICSKTFQHQKLIAKLH